MKDPSASYSQYLNGYAQVIAYTWDSSKLRTKIVNYIYEGQLSKGIKNHKGFGRIINGVEDFLAIGYFSGPQTLQGQFILFENSKLFSEGQINAPNTIKIEKGKV